MLDRSRALQILGLASRANENRAGGPEDDEREAAVAYRELRRHVQARERAAEDEAARELRREELRDLERAWMAFSSLPVPTGIIQPTRPPREFRLAPRWILAWALVATLVAMGLAGYLAWMDRGFAPRVLVDAGGVGGGEGADAGFAIDAEGEGDEGAGGGGEAMDAGPRTELVVESDVEGSLLTVRTRGDAPELVAEGASDETSYWLSPGEYTAEVRHPDCRGAWRQELSVRDQAKLTLDPELCQDTGWMVVRSNVAADELSIDGKKVGETGEQKHRVTPGEHEVRVAKNGYQSWEGIVEVEPGQVLGIRPRLEAVQPARKPRPKKPQADEGSAAAGSQRASGGSPQTDQEREEQYGRWHEDARRWLLARYDFDRSGELDSREEIEAVPCDQWLGLESSYDQSNLGLSLVRFYGFDGSGWRSGALGVSDQARDLAYERMQSCGLR